MILLFWIGFIVFIGVLLAIDLGAFHKQDQEPSSLDALRMTLIWVAVALAFSGFIYGAYQHHWLGIGRDALGIVQTDGKSAMLDFITGYLIEYSLSLDNIFVIALVFAYFKIPGKYQHRVLFWGILGAIVMRAGMILAGTAMVRAFDWMLYFFGAFLLFTAVKMLRNSDEEIHPDQSLLVRLLRKLFPVSTAMDGNHFITRLPDGRKAVTLLLVTLVVVENTDVLFAVDSIPAIFAVTCDPFIVFTSNIFAILGLRSLYFALNAILKRFHLLKFSIVFILAFVGAKMLVSKWIHITSMASLIVIFVALVLGIAMSFLFPPKSEST